MENNTNRIWLFLNTLNDFELANFYHYKYDTFLEHSKKEIDQYFQKKGITIEMINTLIVENEKNNKYCFDKSYCPRCYSYKRVSHWEPLWNESRIEGVINPNSGLTKNILIENCLICGYEFTNQNQRNRDVEDWLFQLIGVIKKWLHKKKFHR